MSEDIVTEYNVQRLRGMQNEIDEANGESNTGKSIGGECSWDDGGDVDASGASANVVTRLAKPQQIQKHDSRISLFINDVRDRRMLSWARANYLPQRSLQFDVLHAAGLLENVNGRERVVDR